MTIGVYASNGAMNVTVVSGLTLTGIYASDGSINVIESPGSSFVGAYHPCGAWYVTVVTSGLVGHYAPDGSMNVAVSPFTASGAVRVNVVSGSFNGGTAGTPIGLLLALTHS